MKCLAHYSLNDSTVQLPYVDVAKIAYNPISKENYKAGVDTYAVLLKWMPVLGAEVFVVEELKKLP